MFQDVDGGGGGDDYKINKEIWSDKELCMASVFFLPDFKSKKILIIIMTKELDLMWCDVMWFDDDGGDALFLYGTWSLTLEEKKRERERWLWLMPSSNV